MDSRKKLVNACLFHKCTLCCYDTEMNLSNKDVNIIRNLGYEETSFVKEKNGLKYLKNRHGKCVFLENYCTIYRNRPEGCQLYPVIFESGTKKVTLDKLCPFNKEFRVSFKKSLQILRLRRLLTTNLEYAS